MRGLRLLWSAATAGVVLFALLGILREAQATAMQSAVAQVEADEQRGGVIAAASWLVETHQNEDGGYTAFSSGAGDAPSDVAGTVDAVLALASTGYNVAAPFSGREQSPLDYLEDNADAVAVYAAQSGASNGKLILALTATGQDPRDFGGYNLAISLTQHLSPTGQYNVVSPFEQSLAILAQSVISEAVPTEAVEWLLAAQAVEGELSGSWDDGFGTAGNTDATAMAIMALETADPEGSADALDAARTFLMENQLESGGWGYAPGLAESANSTALVVQALSALGEDFYSADGAWAAGGVSPLAALVGWQGDSGAFQADFGDGPADDFFTTVQALPALSGRPYPLPAPFEAAQDAVACLLTMRDAESGGWPEFAGSGPSAGGTARAIRAIDTAADLALLEASGGEEAATETPMEALRILTPAYLEGGRGGRLGAVMRSAALGDADVSDFGGLDLPLIMSGYLSPTGEYDNTGFGPYSHAQAMLGLLSAGEEVDEAAVNWLLEAQAENGGWSDADATGISLQVLAQLDREQYTEAIESAVESLRQTQQSDGGWGFALPSSVNSTSEVAQGLVTAGVNPFDPTWSVVVSGTLQTALDVALEQQGDNGCWPNLFGEGDDPYATTDGIILLSLAPDFGSAPVTVAEPEGDSTVEASATSTVEPVVSATEVVPSPTADAPEEEETVPGEEIAEEDAAATTPETPTPPVSSAPPQSQDAENVNQVEPADSGSLLFWLVGALALLILAMVYFRYTKKR